MSTINVIVIENDLAFLSSLENMLKINPDINVLATCQDIEQAYNEISYWQPDLVLLDIELNDGNAFDLLARFQKISFEVVFITAHDEYALRAIQVYALHYLLKPFGVEDLNEALLRLKEKKADKDLRNYLLTLISNKPEVEMKIALPTQTGIVLQDFIDIFYCKSENSYTHFYLKSGEKLVVAYPLKKYEELLCGKKFMRIHQSYIINLQYVKKILKQDGISVVLCDDIILPVSRRKRVEFLDSISKISTFFK